MMDIMTPVKWNSVITPIQLFRLTRHYSLQLLRINWFGDMGIVADGVNRPAVQFDYMAHNGESQSQSTLPVVRPGIFLPKAFENVRQKLRLDPLPVVGDDDLDARVSALKDAFMSSLQPELFDLLARPLRIIVFEKSNNQNEFS